MAGDEEEVMRPKWSVGWMRTVCLALLGVLLASNAVPQTAEEPPDQVLSREFLQQLMKDGVYFFISPKVAESLLTYRVEPERKHRGMDARITGTVIVAFEITKEGNVLHAMATAGNKMIRPAIVAAVRQWKFKPYVLRGEPVVVATSIPVTFDF